MSQDLLKKIYLFEDFPSERLNHVVELTKIETYQKGDEIFAQKDLATSLYVIKFGTVRIYREMTNGDRIEVAMLGTGSHFGEMSFLDKEVRSATAEAVEKSEIIRIPYEKLLSLLNSEHELAAKFYRSLSRFLSGRLRQTTTDLTFAREINLRHF